VANQVSGRDEGFPPGSYYPRVQTSATTARQGFRDALPVFVPAVPFALVLGLAILESGLVPWTAWQSSWVIYGGASQLTLVSLLAQGSGLAAAIGAALIVNARHLMYSAAMAPVFQQQPAWFRWLGAYFLIDQVFALSLPHGRAAPEDFRRYYLAVGLTFWSLWLLFTALGLVLGPVMPTSWGLGFSVPILFLGLLVLGIDRWEKLVAALVAAGCAMLAASLPHRSGLLVGALAGIVAGLLCESLKRR
jgi:4-azaleucine resistance transporter AzlC